MIWIGLFLLTLGLWMPNNHQLGVFLAVIGSIIIVFTIIKAIIVTKLQKRFNEKDNIIDVLKKLKNGENLTIHNLHYPVKIRKSHDNYYISVDKGGMVEMKNLNDLENVYNKAIIEFFETTRYKIEKDKKKFKNFVEAQ